MKSTRFLITGVAVLLLMSMLVVCAAAGAPVTDVNQAVPGLSASATAAGTDSP